MRRIQIKITMYEHHCYRCGKDWISQIDNPKRCGKCKSRSWQTVRGVRCYRCKGAIPEGEQYYCTKEKELKLSGNSCEEGENNG